MNALPKRNPVTVARLLEEQATAHADKVFIHFPEKNQAFTYADLEAKTRQTANLLASLGVGKGDKVALLVPNIPEFLFVYWGAMRIGAVVCPVNTLLKGPEIQYVVDHCEAKVLVLTPEFFGPVADIADQLPRVAHYAVLDDTPPTTGTLNVPSQLNLLAELSHHDTALPTVTLAPDDEAMMIYTSGTTGKPKGVLLTHHNLITDAHYISQWFGFTGQTVMMCILPLFHVNGEVVTMMTPLLIGASVVLQRKFSASTFWATIARYRVNMFSTVPTILSILLAQHDKDGAPDDDISSLALVICGAAPLPVEVHKQFEDTFKVPLYEGYGLSETTCYSTFNPPDPTKRVIGSIGMAVGNDVAIWDEHHQEVPLGQGGEIVIRGENVMKGYFKNPEATEKAFAGGWFHSGDWGMQDENGFFYIVDRVKDMIIRGGENIYPREIDEVLYGHEGIEAAATIGIPDEKYGEAVKSFVVLKPGTSLSEAEVIAYCKARLADFKCPESVAFIDEIPKGPTGKLLRRALRDMSHPCDSIQHPS
ncbi:MAG: long-chain-fatty-acid--CoA ligase, partial [Cyanobacteria bacterium HKST-UBA06]|nr:long-chain-fatty-acid--CoA ligase [Cyanobacteria bacterium HKST-UBA06]